MKHRQLEFVVAIAKTGSFSRAAAMCNATQPTLSNSLSHLEDELGGKLFTRTTRTVKLTRFGEHLLPKMKEALEAQSAIARAASAFRNSNLDVLRIGFSPLIDMSLMDLVLEPFRRTHPRTEIFFKECMLDDLGQRLLEGTVDVSVVPHDVLPGAFEKQPFYEDQLYYLPQSGHKKRLSSPSKLQSLPPSPLIVTGGGCGLNKSLEALFEREKVSWTSYSGHALSYQIIAEWADLGIGAGILPKAKLSPSSQSAVPLSLKNGKPACFQFDWVWPSDPPSSEGPGATLMKHIKNTVPGLIDGLDR